jgi:hypothetical protein
MKMGGQLRTSDKSIIGFDMNAAFALAAALGVNPFIVAEILPAIEAVAIPKINEAMRG